MGSVSRSSRRGVQVETDQLRMTVTQEGGHIAELLHKDTAISPLGSRSGRLSSRPRTLPFVILNTAVVRSLNCLLVRSDIISASTFRRP